MGREDGGQEIRFRYSFLAKPGNEKEGYDGTHTGRGLIRSES